MKKFAKNCAILMVASLQAAALPSISNKCGEKKINLALPSETDIIAFDKECESAFIGPPSSGIAEVVSVLPSANLAFCPTVKTLPNVVNKLATSIDYWMERLTEATNEILKLEKERDRQRNILIDYEETLRSLEEELTIQEAKLALIANDLEDTKKEHNKCLVINDDKTICEGHEKAIRELKRNYINYQDIKIDPLSDEISKLKQRASSLKRKLNKINENIRDNSETFEGYKKRLRSLRNEAIEDYGVFGLLEGMTAQILFDSNWSDQIEFAKT